MKKIFRSFAAVLLVLAFACFAFGDDFKSLTISSGGSSETIRVHNGQFMIIRNFTQDDLTGSRGVVMVAKPPGGTTVNVLSAAALDASPPDIINTVLIAGPADVTIVCGDTTGNCFVSFKKKDN